MDARARNLILRGWVLRGNRCVAEAQGGSARDRAGSLILCQAMRRLALQSAVASAMGVHERD